MIGIPLDFVVSVVFVPHSVGPRVIVLIVSCVLGYPICRVAAREAARCGVQA